MRWRGVAGMLLAAGAGMLSAGCDEGSRYGDTAYGNFDALWEILDTRYCFFEEKGIDWESIGREYRGRITPETNEVQLFGICAEMLDELKDGHVNLISSFNTSYYRSWWSDYPQDFNLRTLQEYYIGYDYWSTSGISYVSFDGIVGYMYYPSFSSGIGELNLDYVLAALSGCGGLIIDVRNNGGGLLTNVETLVSRFIDRPVCGGYIRHKTGPGHGEFSEPFAITYEPAPEGRIRWLGKPVVILTNRSCFSAANDFVAVMKSLPNVTVIGARTGGGGGLPFSSELPNGWGVRFSASPVTDPSGELTENGIDPTPGFEVSAPADELAAGRDAILDCALNYLMGIVEPPKPDAP